MFSKNPHVDERSPSTWKVFLILTNTLLQFGHFPLGGLTAHLLVWPEVVRLWVSLAPLLWPLLQHTQGPRVKLCKRHCRLYIGPFSLIVSNSIHNEGLLNFCWSTGVQKLRQKTKSGEILQRDDKNGFPSSDEQCVSFSARQGNEI